MLSLIEARLSARPGAAVALIAVTLAVATVAAAEAPVPPPGSAAWPRSPRLLGNPGNARSGLEASGVALQLFYNQYLGWRARGGSDPGDGLGTSGSYDLFVQLDLEELASRPGLQLVVQTKGQYDRNINEEVGALSNPVDDADFDEAIYLDQLWVQQAFWHDRAMLRVGFLEHQNVFDRNAYANNEDRQFSATFFDNNPLVPLPNSLGAVVWGSPFSWLEIALGVSDPDNKPRNAGFHTAFDSFDSLAFVLEATLHTEELSVGLALPGSYHFGVFRDGKKRSVFGSSDLTTGRPRTSRGHYGAYLSLDQSLYRERDTVDQGLGLFGRAGFGDEDVNRIDWFASLGFQYRGLVPGRDADVLGIAGYRAWLSDQYSEARRGALDRETGIEIYYQWAALPWLAVTPHLQYIASPGGDRNVTDAIVALLRLRFTL